MLSSSSSIGNLWSTGDTSQTIYVFSSGNVTLVTQNEFSCLSPSASVNLNFNPNPSAPLLNLSTSNPLCQGDTVQLSANISSGISWSTGESTQTINVSNSGNYFAFVTDANSCVSDTALLVVLFNANPPTPVLITSGPVNFCNGDSVILSSSALSGNIWSTGETTASITVATSGNYSVTVNDANGCSSNSALISVNVFSNPPVPLVTLSGGPIFCNGDSVLLTSSSSIGNSWNTGDTTQIITVSNSGTYFVTVGATGCSSASAAISVTELSLSVAPSITASDTNFCVGQSATLTSNLSSGNLWSTGDTTTSIIVSSAGQYSLFYIDQNLCNSDTSTINIQVNNLPASPTITTLGNTTFCDGDSVQLSVSPGTGIIWAPIGASDSVIYVTTSGVYSVSYTDVNGCSSLSQPIQTLVNPLPNSPLIINSGPLNFCDGDSVSLLAQPGNGITWLPGNSIDSIIVVTQSGTYSATYTDQNGCTSMSQTVSVVVNPNPTAPLLQLSESDSSICQGQTIQISSNLSNGVTWFPSGVSSSAISVSTPGIYSAVYLDANGCFSDTASVLITVNQNPEISSVVQIDSASCGLNNGGVSSIQIFNGTPNYSYQWLSNSTLVSIDSVLQNASGGIYELVVIDANGCSDTLSNIDVPSSEGVVITAVSDVYQGLEGISPLVNSITLSGSPVSYTWNLNGSLVIGASDSLLQLQNLSQGTYTVQVIAENNQGCLDTAQVLIVVDANIEIEIPNVFSPNGDQANDLFTIQVKGMKDFSILIYDRWGILLWKGYGPNSGWDGRAPNGEKVPEGTYFYIFKGTALNEKLVEKTGFVLLAD